MKSLQTVMLVAGTICTGLTAGLFAGFAYAVMPGLNKADDRAFVEVVQNINKAILNPLFMTLFFGGLVFTAVALVMHWRGSDRPALGWIIAGLALYLLMFLITSGVNVPLNDKLEAAGNPDNIKNLAAVRDDFETKWVVWNIIRALANTAALGCLIWALVLYGGSLKKDRSASMPAQQGSGAMHDPNGAPAYGSVSGPGSYGQSPAAPGSYGPPSAAPGSYDPPSAAPGSYGAAPGPSSAAPGSYGPSSAAPDPYNNAVADHREWRL